MPLTRSFRKLLPALCAAAALAGCSVLPSRDPLNIDVAGIDALPSEGLEIRLAVRIRIQNPNAAAVEFTGAALDLDLNDRKLASGVSGEGGTVPRYGETVLVIPVTISAFNVARQLLGFLSEDNPQAIRYRVSGKLEGGLVGTRRFTDTGSIDLVRPRG